MKRIFELLAVIMVAFALFSCDGKKNAEVEQEAPEAKVLQVDDALAKIDAMVGDTVEVEGVCMHLCRHSGRKMFLMGSDDTQVLRVESVELGEPFKQECLEHIVYVKGIVREERIDEDYLNEWEKELAGMEQHGEGAEGCGAEKQSRQETANTPEARIADFRAKIAERKAKEGKAYLSFYHIDAVEYNVIDNE